MQGLELLIEELFVDVQTLEEAGTPASEHEVLWVLHDLADPLRRALHRIVREEVPDHHRGPGLRLALPSGTARLHTAEVLLVKTAARNAALAVARTNALTDVRARGYAVRRRLDIDELLAEPTADEPDGARTHDGRRRSSCGAGHRRSAVRGRHSGSAAGKPRTAMVIRNFFANNPV